MISIYKIYLLKKFSKKIFLISLIFFSLVLIINLLEEINFLKDTNAGIIIAISLSFLNGPSLIYEMFPFIFFISTQFFFIDLFENKEIYILRQFGFNNIKLLNFISGLSFIFGILIIIVFYNFSAILKNEYLKIKNNYADDKKYLAVITKNGIWIKDSSNEEIVIINADKIEKKYLINTSLTQLDKNFNVKKNIIAEKINIENFDWVLHHAIVIDPANNSKKYDQILFKSTFDLTKINSLFSDLTSLTFFGLLNLQNNYESIGYSTSEINIQKQKIFSLPILLTLMSTISIIMMLNNNFKKKKFFNLLLGVLFSVIFYYLSHFSNLLGNNGKLPLILSVWFPLIIIFMISLIGIVKLNEK